MAALPTSKPTLHPLHRASGSATYITPFRSPPKSLPLTILVAVNFPLEVARRSDELPEQLLIDVNIRPAKGVGQVRERHVEGVVKRCLGAVVRGEDWGRQSMAVGLQVLQGDDGEQRGGRYLDLLVGCVNAAVLGCLDAAVTMKTVCGAALVGLKGEGGAVGWPDVNVKGWKSLHAFAFDVNGGCLLSESEGRFGIEEWAEAEGVARELVLGKQKGQDGDVDMTTDEAHGVSVVDMLRSCIQDRVKKDERWRNG